MRGYNYCLKHSQFELLNRDVLRRKIKENNLDCPETEYGIFYKADDYDAFDNIMEETAKETGVTLERSSIKTITEKGIGNIKVN